MNWGNVAVCAVCFAIGFGLAAYRGEAELSQAELDAAIIRANDGRKHYERIIEAQNALDAARRDNGSLRESLDGLRRARSQRPERASADSCRVEREAVSRCERLLSESSELLAEGAGLLRRNAATHDALADAVGG